MTRKKHEKAATATEDSGSIASMMIFICWSAFLIIVLVAPGEKGTSSYRKSHGGLLGLNLMIFFLLFLGRHDLPNTLRAARRVLRSPFSSTLHDYDEFFMVLCVVGAAITTIFVVDFGGADVLAFKTGIVAFLIGLKVAYDRWRANKRKR